MTQNLTELGLDTPTEVKSELVGSVEELKAALLEEPTGEEELTLTPSTSQEVVEGVEGILPTTSDVVKATAQDLSKRLKVDYPHVTGMLKVLEKLGIARQVGKVKGSKAVLWELPSTIVIPLT